MRNLIILTISFLITLSTNAKNIYVSPTGSDANTGLSIDKPLKTIDAGINKAVAGDSILLRGGTYTISTTISISKTGSNNAKYYLLAYEGEQPVLDCSSEAFGKKGMSLSGNYWFFKGIQIKGAGDNGIYVSGNYNRFENCAFYDNRDTGMQFGGGASYNEIINCDSYYNADPTDYGDADGFAIKMDVGSHNYFYGCRAWLNCDDGWDGYLRGTDNVTNELENCWVMKNGWLKDGTDPGPKANGNGFKMGGSDDKTLKHNVTLTNCLAFDNKSKGFDQNNNKGNMTIINGTAYNNLGNNFSIPSSLPVGFTATVTNCAELGGKINFFTGVVESHNSWLTFDVTSADFISIDSEAAYGPRKADGSLPDITYMHLAQGSQLIDAGIDVGIPYFGSAPDMGAFESNYPNGINRYSIADKDFTITPNPVVLNANINFNLQTSGKVYFEIYSINGSKVKSTSPTEMAAGTVNKMIDCSELPKGIYICQMVINGEIAGVTRLVKK